MKHAPTKALYAYWDQLRAGRSAPDRSDLDPGAIRTLLGDVFLLELGGKDRHIVRLAGTRICTLLGRELKGRPFAEGFAAEDWPELFALLDGVAGAAVPVVAGVVGETEDGRTIDLELLVLPLRHRGRTHSRLLGSLAAGEWPYWAGSHALVRLRLVSTRYLTPDAADEIDLLTASVRAAGGPLRLVPGGRS
ncbi:MAG TPA: PAS domain-containing protein [Xanthobacteraceae bacterium]|jgi:hypothetical protein